LIITGLSFFMMFVFNPRDWQVLIPSALLTALGVIFFFAELGYWYYWDIWDNIWRFWPLVLILIGISMVWKRRERTR
jgi:hypothetical protein